jgi:bifunctional UDP-N-acetylglucosamine pyrophosphorylase / glucosamine-1-phosphate N-acetyltransferase
MYPIHVILLAAGLSSRFGLEFNKLLTPLCGVPLIMHAVRALEPLDAPITVVVGHQREQMMHTISQWCKAPVSFAVQEEQRGTGHAVASARDQWDGSAILVLNGDMPLVTHEIITALYDQHQARGAAVSFVTAMPDTDLHAYGRVVQTERGIQIIEAKDFTGVRDTLYPINAGIYLFDRIFLEQSIDLLTTHNAHKELYLTDLIGIASTQGLTVATIEVPFDTVRGVNTIAEFAKAQSVERARIVNYWMAHGVLCMAPDDVYIDADVVIGRGTVLQAPVHLRGNTTIGAQCVIDAHTILENAILEDRVTVHPHSLIRNARIGTGRDVGPFAHIYMDRCLNAAQVVVSDNSNVTSDSAHCTPVASTP